MKNALRTAAFCMKFCVRGKKFAGIQVNIRSLVLLYNSGTFLVGFVNKLLKRRKIKCRMEIGIFLRNTNVGIRLRSFLLKSNSVMRIF